MSAPKGSAPAQEDPGRGSEALRRLEAITDTSLADLPLDALLVELLDRVRGLLSADTAAILLLENDVLIARAARGLEEEVEARSRVPLGAGFAGRVAAERRPIIIDDVAQADIYNPILRQKGLRSLLGVPVRFEGRVIGVLHVGTYRPRAFARSDAELLQVVADRVGLGIAYSRLYERERQAREEAETANRTKDTFLAVLSHELRTPLGAIRTWASLLRSGKLDAARAARAAEAIERNVVAQARLIEDLLDVSRIHSGKLQLEVDVVDLKAVIDAAVDALRGLSDERQIVLEKRVPPAAVEMRGDAARLQQVVANLLANAIKFSAPGTRVVAELARDEGFAVLSVVDEGEGIETAVLPQIFEPFRQGDSTTTRSHSGLGLGLAIVRHIAEAHGGTVRAESEGKGRGARFTVRLPLEAEPGERHAAVAVRSAITTGALARHAPLAGARVLLVEDEPEAREAIAAALQTSGAHVMPVPSARTALEALRREPFDVLVSDIAMPGEDGFGLIEAVRSVRRDQGGALPAVAVTAFASAADRRRALDAGFAAYLAKPVDAADLVEELARLVQQDGNAGAKS